MDLIGRMAEEVHREWLCFGDFNLMLNPKDKEGGAGVDWNLITDFRKTLNQCGLCELSFTERRFT